MKRCVAIAFSCVKFKYNEIRLQYEGARVLSAYAFTQIYGKNDGSICINQLVLELSKCKLKLCT